MMEDKKKIGGVMVGAPLWHGATEAELKQIVAHLSAASCHYADDSAEEWRKARKELQAAAILCAGWKFQLDALQCLHKHTDQLVAFDQFVNAVMRAQYDRGVKDGYDEASRELAS